jgi:hypothetical protein
MKRSWFWPIVLVMVTWTVFAGPARVNAGMFAIEVITNAGKTIVNDGDPLDSASAPNAITFTLLNSSGYSLVSVIASTNTPGDGSGARLTLQAMVDAGLSPVGPVTILASATGFTQPPSSANPLKLVSALAGSFTSTAGSVTGQQWADLTSPNVLFGEGGPTPGPQGPFSTPIFTSTLSTGFSSLATPFTLTDQITVNQLSGFGIASGTLASTVTPTVPAPAGFVLVLGSLPALGLGLWRRRQRQAPAPS